jgi:hypothetical protein
MTEGGGRPVTRRTGARRGGEADARRRRAGSGTALLAGWSALARFVAAPLPGGPVDRDTRTAAPGRLPGEPARSPLESCPAVG